MLDYRDRLAAIVWFAGCNLRCGYCYNPDIVNGRGRIAVHDVLAFLRSRVRRLDGVVLSGGEPTLYAELPEFMEAIHELGFEIKLDTNAINGSMLRRIVENDLADFIAVDYKAPERLFGEITGRGGFAEFSSNLEMLLATGIPLEVRTTVHPDFLDEDSVIEIIRHLADLKYDGVYALQFFMKDVPTLAELASPDRRFEVERVRSAAETTGISLELRNWPGGAPSVLGT